MSWVALLQAALEGLASVKFFYQEWKEADVANRIQKLEVQNRALNEAVTSLALATTSQERDEALKNLANSHRA